MAYCNLADVQALIKTFRITETTSVTPEEVLNDIIPEVDRRINERLGKYYRTPITGVNSLITINRISRWLASAELLNRVYLGEAPSASEQAKEYTRLAEADLCRITSGEVILTDAGATDDTPEPLSKKIGSNVVKNYSIGTNPGSFFFEGKRW